MAGPWFTVHRGGDDWQRVDTIWLSNGLRTDKARVEFRMELENVGDET